MALSETTLLAALRTVDDPELHRDLVSLGMIKDLSFAGGEVTLTVNLTTPACPMKAQIERDVRAALSNVPGVETVKLLFDAQVRASSQKELPGVKNVIAVGSRAPRSAC
jgi:ATP-binding protein involved in chromosome partitioning